ncbi:hypothetical protein OF83DRAFT_1177511 [Amylostereum chailletii]|nr:hypothetical protein OF83DRAFT_1177511 [Amylostereum chailletii]
MTSSISDTTPSPTPFSPFSTHSGGSDLATSDESPDLGAFTTVFRAFQELQPRTFPTHFNNGLDLSATTPTTSSLSPTELSDPNRSSTVWNNEDLPSYLSFSSRDATSRHTRSIRSPPPSSTPSDSDTEGEPGDDDEYNDDPPRDQPSLGNFDAAIEFLAGERARFAARRDTALRGNSSTSDGAWEPQPAPPRRKRRRKKAKSPLRPLTLATRDRDGNDTHQSRTETLETEQDAEDESSSSPDISSSSPANPKSSPATPLRRRRERERGTRPAAAATTMTATTDTHRLVHSLSTPSLRSAPLDPQVVRLRSLAMKLKFLFPTEADRLAYVLSNASLNASTPDFIDTRGPAPRATTPNEPITHVFIDHSNILIGFLTYLRLHPHQLPSNKVRHLSHAALSLVLERGRPISRRVLAASSPLYQPIDAAEQLGYEVHVYARVPDTGDGADRVRPGGGSNSNSNSTIPTISTNTSTKTNTNTNTNTNTTAAATSTNTASATGGSQATSQGRATGGSQASSQGRGRHWRTGSRSAPKGHARGPSGSGATTTTTTTAVGTPNGGSTESEPSSSSAPPAPSGRVRYREQGVDELLQLKLHQALAGDAPPPAGSTIVLATGDGNVGQYNEEGFIGCVRLALKKRWRVELHAWESGLSREWMRAFGDEDGFKVEAMDRFAGDLLVA